MAVTGECVERGEEKACSFNGNGAGEAAVHGSLHGSFGRRDFYRTLLPKSDFLPFMERDGQSGILGDMP